MSAVSAEPIRLLLMTCPQDQVTALLETLLTERLIACGNVIAGALSRYWWQGALCSDTEALVVMETATSRVAAWELPRGHAVSCSTTYATARTERQPAGP